MNADEGLCDTVRFVCINNSSASAELCCAHCVNTHKADARLCREGVFNGHCGGDFIVADVTRGRIVMERVCELGEDPPERCARYGEEYII